MVWEWVAPVGTVLGASIGAFVGGRFSRGTQARQHAFEREAGVVARGHEKAEEAMVALRFLQRHRRTVAEWNSPAGEGDLDRTYEEHDRLGRAVEYLTDEAVRRQVELVHDVIGDSFVVTRFGTPAVGNSEPMIWRACHEGLAVLGRYVRSEPSADPSDYMKSLQAAFDSGHAEMARQHDEELQERHANKSGGS